MYSLFIQPVFALLDYYRLPSHAQKGINRSLRRRTCAEAISDHNASSARLAKVVLMAPVRRTAPAQTAVNFDAQIGRVGHASTKFIWTLLLVGTLCAKQRRFKIRDVDNRFGRVDRNRFRTLGYPRLRTQ
jgi:hypothetical protein